MNNVIDAHEEKRHMVTRIKQTEPKQYIVKIDRGRGDDEIINAIASSNKELWTVLRAQHPKAAIHILACRPLPKQLQVSNGRFL